MTNAVFTEGVLLFTKAEKLQNIWATFATKFVAKTFQNMPKQVTLTIRQFFKNLWLVNLSRFRRSPKLWSYYAGIVSNVSSSFGVDIVTDIVTPSKTSIALASAGNDNAAAVDDASNVTKKKKLKFVSMKNSLSFDWCNMKFYELKRRKQGPIL